MPVSAPVLPSASAYALCQEDSWDLLRDAASSRCLRSAVEILFGVANDIVFKLRSASLFFIVIAKKAGTLLVRNVPNQRQSGFIARHSSNSWSPATST
jgi:hypothetical protein